MAHLITAEGEVKEVFPKTGKLFTLQELQEFVGGYIEVVRFKKKSVHGGERGRKIDELAL